MPRPIYLLRLPPLERAVEKWRFEVLRKRVFERFDASESRVTFSPKIDIFQRAFERNRVAFSLDTFFWQGKRKYLAKGEIFVKRYKRRSKNDANKLGIRKINDRFWHKAPIQSLAHSKAT